MSVLDAIAFDAAGLVPAVAQQYDTGEVLMLAWMDDEALRRTLATGRVTYWSRSRREYWTKGDTSGNVQIVKLAVDQPLEAAHEPTFSDPVSRQKTAD